MIAPRIVVEDIRVTERLVRFQAPFRFGAVTVTEAPQAFVHATIAVDGHGRSTGASAELMVPKWFNKNPALTAGQTVDELRRSLAIARDLYLAEREGESAFALHAAVLPRQLEACGEERMPPLAAAYGPAEIDKAILDALLRALGLDVFAGLARNVVGLDTRLTPDIEQSDIDDFLHSRRPPDRIAVRHTVGMIDDPESLRAVVAEGGCRYFKIKLSGDVARDLERLVELAAVFDARGVEYRATLDANEQFAGPLELNALLGALLGRRELERLASRLLYVEQPFPREIALDTPLGDTARDLAFIIDEADDSTGAFPRARALGYRGVSSKSCKGLYKSLLNGARSAKWNAAGAETFVSAEDLTCQAGLAVQQDTALAAFLGCPHAERNGHHYVDGFDGTPRDEARAFLKAHPDLYEERGGRVRLSIRDGALSTASLHSPGFASGVRPEQVGAPHASMASTR